MDSQTVSELTEKFGIAEVLTFSQAESGSIRAHIKTATCAAEIFMQGAHISQWQPVNQKPVLYLSEKSVFATGKAIRGGIPLIFPWFGPRNEPAGSAQKSPAHGFARTSNNWYLTSAQRSKDDLEVAFSLRADDISRSFGFDEFDVTYKISIGEELELMLIVKNEGVRDLKIEEAFHTYLAVSDIEKVSLHGLQNTEFLDKTDGSTRKQQNEAALALRGETDRPYLNTDAAVTVEDEDWHRKIVVGKLNSKSTVIWNPWSEQTAKLADMPQDGWKKMVCVETANLAENDITIPPGKHHAMHANIRVEPLD